MKNIFKVQNGKVNRIPIFIIIFFVALLIVAIIPLLNTTAVASSINMLEERGYVVLSSAEYALIAKEATAHAAVDQAELAVIAAQTAAAKVDLFNSAEVFLFPSVTNVTVTIVAGDTNVWSDWAEIADSLAVTLSSKFALVAGYINDMYIYDHSAVDKVYCLELSYGAAHTTLGRMMWHTSYKDTVQIKSRRVPAGETIYYRLMCSGADHATAKIGFRYFFE